jgi:molybdenum cofactor guanylyltransferase
METIVGAFSAVLLAGGRSVRMGRDKAQIAVNWKGDIVPLRIRQLGLLQSLGPAELFYSASAGKDEIAGAKTIVDQWSNAGPLSGIASCLGAATKELVLFLAVDVARMEALFLEELLKKCAPAVGIVPQIDGRYEPLVAVYPRSCVRFAVNQISRGQLRPQDLVQRLLREQLVQIYQVPPSETALFANWNRPEDIEEVKGEGGEGER